MATLPSSSFLHLQFRSLLISSNLEPRARSAMISRRNSRGFCLCKLRTRRVGPFLCRSIGNDDSEEETGIGDQGKTGEDGDKLNLERKGSPTSVSSRVCRGLLVLYTNICSIIASFIVDFDFTYSFLVSGYCNRVQSYQHIPAGM
jgi:hypothetical protein